MKHPQTIAAILKSAFGPLEPGINEMQFGTFIERVQKSLFLGRRHELETNENFGQVLPYCILRQGDKVFTYTRTKMVGEQRLAGMSSVGIGGHIDLIDVLFTENSVVDIMGTLAHALTRELGEEIEFEASYKLNSLRDMRDEGFDLTPRFQGVINDITDPVGRVHYGLLFIIEVPEKFKPVCAEAELTTRGMLAVEALKTEVLESWSNLVIKYLAKK